MKRKEFVVSLAIMATAAAPAFAQVASQAGPAQAAPTASSPVAVEAVATLQKACLPMLRGEKVTAAARSAGFQIQDGGWVRPIAGKDEIDLDPPDSANPHVCTLTITAAPGDEAAMRAALGAWTAAQSPPLAALGADKGAPAAQGWVTSTWSAQTPSGDESVVLTQPQPAPGQSQQSTLLVSLSPT